MSETKEAVINQSIALPPTLPIIAVSPIFAIPTTNVVKTNGAIIICTNLMKIVPRSFIFLEKDSVFSGN